MDNSHGYNRNQLLAACTVMLLVPALRLMPSAAAETAGRAAWLAPLLAFPPVLGYIFFLGRFLGTEGPVRRIRLALGETAGRIALALLGLWLTLYAGFLLRSGAERLMTTVYPNSGPAPFVLTMGLLALTAALGSVRTLLRAAKLILPAVTGVLLLILLFSLFTVDAENLLPLSVYLLPGSAKGAVAAVDIFAGALLGASFLEGGTAAEPGRTRQFALWLGAMCLLLSLLCLDIVGNFGAELCARLTRPFFSLVRNLVFFRTLERTEALVVALWVLPDFIILSVFLYAAQLCLRHALGFEPGGEKPLSLAGGRWMIWLCAAAAAVCALLLAPDAESMALWSERIVPIGNLTVCFVFLPLIFLFGKIKKRL